MNMVAPAVVMSASPAVMPTGPAACEATPPASFMAELLAMIAPPPDTTAVPVVVKVADEPDTAEIDGADEALASLAGVYPIEQIINGLPVVPVAVESAAPSCETDSELPAEVLTGSLQRGRAARVSILPDADADTDTDTGADTGAGTAKTDVSRSTDVIRKDDAKPAAASVPRDSTTVLAAVATELRTPEVSTANQSPSQPPAVSPSTPVVAATAAATPEQMPAPHLHQPVGAARWADELGTRITLMAARGHQSGSLSLSPEHLGPLEVRININQDTANVWFGAQHADTRAALQEALPRLREMLAAAGLALGQASVSHETPRQNGQGAESPRSRRGPEAEGTVTELRTPLARRIAAGLIDTYA